MMEEKFSYSSQPQAVTVKSSRLKYRDDNENEGPTSRNIMHDARIIRGNTYAAKVLTSNQVKDSTQTWRRREPPKRRFIGRRVSTPPPVDGRVHMDMQTEDYLEELTDRPIEMDAETQTQPFMDRPPSPLFVRAKTGQDAATQIFPGDLFDFDLEVEPILEVLVGKTIHVSMLELLQEEELEAIRLQQEEYEMIRNVELAEVQRLEAEARRRAQEKKRRIEQEKQRVEQKRILEEKIAARQFSQQYLGSLHTNVFELLQEEGVFYDPVEKEVQDIFLSEVQLVLRTRVDSYELARQMADELLEAARTKAKLFEAEAIRLRQEYYERMRREEALLAQARLEAEQAAARKKAEDEANGIENEDA